MSYTIHDFLSKEQIDRFCRKHHIKKIALFGSALHEELRPESDIDLLVEFEDGHIPGLITLSGIENELSRQLGRKVDLRTPKELSVYFRDDVVREAKVQYEAG
jgi:predicted nucleotidyltransferase